MDTRDGRIYANDIVKEFDEVDKKYIKQMNYHPTPIQRATGIVGRNDTCPCGSQRKFKKCCLFNGK